MAGGRRLMGLALVLAVGLTACGSDGDRDEGVPSETTVKGRLASVDVETTTMTFVDDSRETPRSGDAEALPERTLETTIYRPAATEDGPYPLLVFSHGLGGALEFYDDTNRAVAAAGFVVVAPSFPLTRPDAPSGPDAGDTQNQPGDVTFLLDSVLDAVEDGEEPLADIVDVEHIGAFGHSNGGITTLGVASHTCCQDDRIDAVVVLAGNPAPFAGGEYDFGDTPPMLLVHGTADDLVPYEEAQRVFNELDAAKGLLTVEDGDHGDYLASGAPQFGGFVATVTDFFRAHLAGDDDAGDRLRSEDPGDGMTLRYAAEEGSGVTVVTQPPRTGREASATPTEGLTDGQVVTVSWENFTPGKVVNIVQCSQGGTQGSDACDLTKGLILRPNPTGSGSLPLEIVAGPVGSGTCDATTDDCVIMVNDGGLQDPAATVRIPISFAG